MTIRTKTFFLLGLAFVVLVGAMILTAGRIILQGYQDLERDFANRNLQRAVNVLSIMQEKLYASTVDYASWDDTYEFIRNPDDSSYRLETFAPAVFDNLNINAMLFFDNSNEVKAEAFMHPLGKEITHTPREIIRAVTAIPELLPLSEHVKGRFGIIGGFDKPLIVAARPILRSSSQGPSRGTLIFCQLIDAAEMEYISSIVTWPVSVIDTSSTTSSPDSLLLREFLSGGKRQLISTLGGSTLRGYISVPDITGSNRFVLSCSSNRDIFRYGQRALVYCLGWLILIIIVFGLIVMILIERGVLDRFSRLRNAIDMIKYNPEPSRRLPVSGNDEVTALTADINRMLEVIEQAQQRAQQSKQQYRLLFEQMLNGFALFETVRDNRGAVTDYRFLEVNPAFERLTGIPVAACAGATVREKLTDMGPQWVEQLTQVVQTGVAHYFEGYSATMKKHFEVLVFKAADDRCGTTFTDATIRKKAEMERTRAQEDLAQAQKMQAVGQLAGGIAHDFNNQLAGILGYAELLQTNLTETPKLSTYIDRVITGISRAADLTSQLLAFAHKGKYIDRPVNMHSIIMEVSSLLERSIDKRIEIIHRLGAAAAVTLGDPTQLQNVILNLGLNARDAMPDGGYLTFATEQRIVDEPFRTRHSSTLAPGHYLMLSITDTGTGISPETQKHLFEPFFTTKPRSKGTGMGLAASYGTIIQHNGAITVYSEVGKGTTFNIYLPLCGKSAEEPLAIKKLTTIPGNPRILIIDDEAMVADMADEMLTVMGCTIRLCANGREAVELYRSSWKEFDLIILDMIMPEMNGTETFRLLRTINPHARVLISSGYSMNNEAQSLLNAGAKAFIQKPYTRSVLGDAIVNILTGP